MKQIRQVFNWTLIVTVMALLNLLLTAPTSSAQVSIISGTYSQNFDSLSSTVTSSALPSGWLMLETGTNANSDYIVGTGSGNSGDTYSFGATSNSERAFGGLQSGSLVPTIGAFFKNFSGNVINSISITYTGEQWRLGTSGRNDQLIFEYSLDATSISLSAGTWVPVSGLLFTAPIGTGTAGLLNGNAAANRITMNATITSLTLPTGSNIYIRWRNVDATGADDGLGIDDFSLTFTNAVIVPTISLVNPNSSCDGSGDVINITGTNLGSITGVNFNGTPASFTLVSATLITATLPAGATTGLITITDGTNSANSPSAFTVNPLPAAPVVTGGGTFCGSALITASGGAGGTIYFQQQVSGGTSTYTSSTTWAITNSGTYYFRSLSSAGCWGPEGSTTVIINSAATPVTIFTESIGTVAGTTAIASHESANGFDNDGYTMSGTGDVRVTTPSSGYTGASGGANVFLTNTSVTTFQIAGINSNSFQEITVGFGVHKSTTASNGSELIVEISSDGVSYSPLTFAALPVGSATWNYRTATGIAPQTNNLRIRFRNTAGTPQFRIDDVSLTGSNSSATITAGGPTAICPGGNVTLSAPIAASYLWSNGLTTQNIIVSAAGSYSCQLTLPNSCVVTSNTINVTMLSAPAFAIASSSITDFASATSCNKIVNYTAVATGDPSPTYTYSFSGVTTGSGVGTGSGSAFNTGTTTVVVTATNSCGTAISTINIVITDNTPPVANCQNVTVNLDATGNASITPAQINNGSTDNCAIAGMTLSQSTFNCATISGNSVPTDLFISEYIEGSSNNKCIEVFNGTGAPINLTAGGYQLKFYFNGSTTSALSISLTGTLASGDVYVACHASAASNFLSQADVTNGSGWYNGDDAVVLVKNSGTTVLDILVE